VPVTGRNRAYVAHDAVRDLAQQLERTFGLIAPADAEGEQRMKGVLVHLALQQMAAAKFKRVRTGLGRELFGRNPELAYEAGNAPVRAR
jgi:hypothetical protein